VLNDGYFFVYNMDFLNATKPSIYNRLSSISFIDEIKFFNPEGLQVKCHSN
jgi:hypothetical protein